MSVTEFNTLAELFGHTVPPYDSEKKLKFPDDYVDLAIPICQHNLYKYSPFHVVGGTAEHRIVFPENQLHLIRQLQVLPSTLPHL